MVGFSDQPCCVYRGIVRNTSYIQSTHAKYSIIRRREMVLWEGGKYFLLHRARDWCDSGWLHLLASLRACCCRNYLRLINDISGWLRIRRDYRPQSVDQIGGKLVPRLSSPEFQGEPYWIPQSLLFVAPGFSSFLKIRRFFAPETVLCGNYTRRDGYYRNPT